MNPTSFSRRRWFGSALAACAGLGLAGMAEGEPSTPAPEGYTKPSPVSDLGRAPGMQARLVSTPGSSERVYAVVFAKGDEVLSGLTAFAVREKVTAGVFTGIGAFQHAKFGWFDAPKKAYRDIPVGQQVEVISLIGTLGMAEGKPQVHTHASVGLPDGTLRGGHVLEAVVWPTLEVFLTALPVELDKEQDEETGLSLFNLKVHG